MHPSYAYPPSLPFRLAIHVLFGGRRSFRQDGLACVERLNPPLRVLGEENIPRSGPILITFNHYYRPGFNAWWMALALAAVVPAEMYFVMTDELTFPGKWYAPLGRIGSRLLLWRLARIYGFTGMPPMPPRPQDVLRRARAVRRVIAHVRAQPQTILGLAPEGSDQPGGILSLPPRGSGRFIALLASRGFRIAPVGIFEEGGRLCLHFGEAYSLPALTGYPAHERDHQTAVTVMQHLAACLPPRLRGSFG